MQFMINLCTPVYNRPGPTKLFTMHALLTFGTERGPSIDAFQCIAVIYKVSIQLLIIIYCHAMQDGISRHAIS